MIIVIKNKFSGRPDKFEVPDWLCERVGLRADSAYSGESDKAYAFEDGNGKRIWVPKKHFTRIVESNPPIQDDDAEYKPLLQGAS